MRLCPNGYQNHTDRRRGGRHARFDRPDHAKLYSGGSGTPERGPCESRLRSGYGAKGFYRFFDEGVAVLCAGYESE